MGNLWLFYGYSMVILWLIMGIKKYNQYYLVGALEPWNFMTFHSVGNVIIPSDSYFAGG